ncbi:hypothetical protein S7711_06270 [Stachybotrys chartarum IBT 7711]|uniref:Cytochrome P450 n=1 Tax=Stachybotrys chartarum (strain CBS 109288 / IBT 7711) TaxID=1280523 RepID=A0A084B507_STACB|nr:hypothetical protein S7711_06270 [Stachybotrys chartarum IBT 7711]
MDNIVSRPAVVGPVIIAIGYLLYRLFLAPAKLPNLPIVGAKKGDWFPLLQAKWRNTLDFRRATLEAYDKYKNQAALIPAIGFGDAIMLPVSETQWVAEQPEDVLSLHEQAMHSLQTDYTVGDPQLIRKPFHHKLIVTSLTSKIGDLVPDVADECEWSFDKYWGDDTEQWNEIGVYDTLRYIIGSVTNRVFVGLPYCRDMKLVDSSMAFAQDVPTSALVLKFFWAPLRGLAAFFVTIPNRIHENRFMNILRPEVERRLKTYDQQANDCEKHTGTEPEPNDFLQWNINKAKASGDAYECNWKTLAGRVLLLNFAAIHTSSFSITSAVLDLVYGKKEYIEELREEIKTVLAENDGIWTKQALGKMEKLDSTMRESARLNSFVTIGLGRFVTAKDGVTTPSGVHLPHGALVCAHSHPVFREPEIYSDALEFKPFRFAEKRHEEGVEYVKRARNAFATTSAEHLAFGHGRNACPGRFFAANELKLLLGHLLLNYDFAVETERPENKWIVVNLIPPMKTTIKVKRRKL